MIASMAFFPSAVEAITSLSNPLPRRQAEKSRLRDPAEAIQERGTLKNARNRGEAGWFRGRHQSARIETGNRRRRSSPVDAVRVGVGFGRSAAVRKMR